jgi:hypothetical protein
MATFQPAQYRDAASRLDDLGRSVLSGANNSDIVLPAVVNELTALAGDRSGATLKAIGELADRLQSKGSVTPAEFDEITTTLREVADREERAAAEVNNLWN